MAGLNMPWAPSTSQEDSLPPLKPPNQLFQKLEKRLQQISQGPSNNSQNSPSDRIQLEIRISKLKQEIKALAQKFAELRHAFSSASGAVYQKYYSFAVKYVVARLSGGSDMGSFPSVAPNRGQQHVDGSPLPHRHASKLERPEDNLHYQQNLDLSEQYPHHQEDYGGEDDGVYEDTERSNLRKRDQRLQRLQLKDSRFIGDGGIEYGQEQVQDESYVESTPTSGRL